MVNIPIEKAGPIGQALQKGAATIPGARHVEIHEMIDDSFDVVFVEDMGHAKTIKVLPDGSLTPVFEEQYDDLLDN